MDVLESYAIIYKQPVIWGDMDALGHVNNVIYYRYIESARIAYFQALDLFSYELMLVISKSNCHYLSPVVYPDILHIGVRVEEIRQSAIRMSYLLFSESQHKVVATAEAVMVCLDLKSQQKMLIPESLKSGILNLESNFNHQPILY